MANETQPKTLRALLKQLDEQGVHDYRRYEQVRRFLCFKARDKGIPIAGTFELTPLCNLDCKMCYVHLNKDQMRGVQLLSVEQWKNIMQQAIDAGMMYAALTGGECLTYPGFDELYLFLHSRGVQISVLTNAVLMDEARVEFFLKHPPSVIQFTLYGYDEDSYERVTGRREFHRVMENARRADAAGLPIIMSITPNEYLGADNETLVRFAATTGITFRVNSSLMTPREETERSDGFSDLSVDDYMRLFKLEIELGGEYTLSECDDELPEPDGKPGESPRGLRCGGGRSNFNVTWDGELIPCNRLKHLSAKLSEKSFLAAWREINAQAESYLLPCECETCAYRRAARGCAAAHQAKPGHADPEQCKLCRAFVKAGMAKLI